MAGRGHAAHLYGSSDEFCEAVAAYLAGALAAGRPAIAILTPEHRSGVAELMRSPGDIRWVDADETLTAISESGVPAAARFEEVVGGLVDELEAAHPGKPVAAVGEMVEVLVARGEAEAAISLEELWNSLAWSRDFTLLCGYRRDRFDRGEQQDVLAEIVRTHSHVRPAAAAA
jgi:hypothetical protein